MREEGRKRDMEEGRESANKREREKEREREREREGCEKRGRD